MIPFVIRTEFSHGELFDSAGLPGSFGGLLRAATGAPQTRIAVCTILKLDADQDEAGLGDQPLWAE